MLSVFACGANASTYWFGGRSGSVLDFGNVTLRQSKTIEAGFSLGYTGMDENLMNVDGPTIRLTSRAPDVFDFTDLMCFEEGVGINCYTNIVLLQGTLVTSNLFSNSAPSSHLRRFIILGMGKSILMGTGF